MTIFGFPDHHRGLKSDQVTLHMGKKGFFGGFYPFPSKSDLLFVRLSNRLQERVGGGKCRKMDLTWVEYTGF